jgi:hypothetical protein
MSEEEIHPPVDDIESEEESSEEELSDEDIPEEPATPSITNQSLPEVTSQLDNLHLDMGDNSNPRGRQPTPAPTGDRTAILGSAATKVNPPMEFTGRRDQIKSFRLQCKLYWEMNPDKFSNNQRNRLLFAMSYLRGKALEWIQPHMEDFIDHPSGAGVSARTLELLNNDAAFFKAIKETFDVGNDTLEADRDLRALRQRASAAAYRAEFSILAAKVGWNDDALASQFYRGLKEQVRVEITMRHERPSTLKGMADLAIEIDSRIFEVQMEKKGNYFQGKANTKVQRDVPAWNNNYYGLQKMQLDATKGKPGSNNNKSPKNGQNKKQPKTKGTTDKSNVECYGCHQKGHYKSECNARKQRHDLQGSGQQQAQDKSFRATKGPGKEVVEEAQSLKATQGRGGYQEPEPITIQDPHGMESWTACFDDNCTIHLSDKFGSGYWPAKKTRSVCRTIGQPAEEVRYIAGYPPQNDDSGEEESSEEEGEIADSDGEPEELETTEFTRTADSNDAILRVLRLVWESKNFILPWNGDGDEQMVNERELWILIGKIRAALWRMPHEKHSTDYTRVVQEYPPLGSTFTSDSSYTTREGIIFSPELRSRLREVKTAFCEEAATQARDGGAQYSSGSVELYTLPQRLVPPQIVFEEPEEVRRRPQITQQRPRTLQERPPTPYTSERSVWEPALNTSDPNYVPRRPISMRGTQAEGSLDPRRQVILGRTSRKVTGN